MVPVLTELMDPQQMKSVKNVHIHIHVHVYVHVYVHIYVHIHIHIMYMYMYTLKFLRNINFIYFCILQYLDDLATVGKDEVHLNTPYREG